MAREIFRKIKAEAKAKAKIEIEGTTSLPVSFLLVADPISF